VSDGRRGCLATSFLTRSWYSLPPHFMFYAVRKRVTIHPILLLSFFFIHYFAFLLFFSFTYRFSFYFVRSYPYVMFSFCLSQRLIRLSLYFGTVEQPGSVQIGCLPSFQGWRREQAISFAFSLSTGFCGNYSFLLFSSLCLELCAFYDLLLLAFVSFFFQDMLSLFGYVYSVCLAFLLHL
jgi:hypothetical protein